MPCLIRYGELWEAYFSGKLFPLDLKNGVADSLGKVLEPVRAYFAEHPDNYEAMKAVFETSKLR